MHRRVLKGAVFQLVWKVKGCRPTRLRSCRGRVVPSARLLLLAMCPRPPCLCQNLIRWRALPTRIA